MSTRWQVMFIEKAFHTLQQFFCDKQHSRDTLKYCCRKFRIIGGCWRLKVEGPEHLIFLENFPKSFKYLFLKYWHTIVLSWTIFFSVTSGQVPVQRRLRWSFFAKIVNDFYNNFIKFPISRNIFVFTRTEAFLPFKLLSSRISYVCNLGVFSKFRF